MVFIWYNCEDVPISLRHLFLERSKEFSKRFSSLNEFLVKGALRAGHLGASILEVDCDAAYQVVVFLSQFLKKSGIKIAKKSHGIEKSRDFREIPKNPNNEKNSKNWKKY